MRNGTPMSVQITCLGWHWYPYRYSRTVDDDDGRPVAPFPGWVGELALEAVEDVCRIDLWCAVWLRVRRICPTPDHPTASPRTWHW